MQNNIGAHDPSSIIKCGDTYWIFTTGYGIYAMYSKDLVKWTAGKTPFDIGYYPPWIDSYVNNFEGHFWAPECYFMNGKYYLYYSCSSWGVKKSVIGLLTNVTLDPDSKDYFWQDEGMVEYSTVGSDANCIDPSVFPDDEGKLWLTYGSYFGGIRITELDKISGKLKGSYQYPVASGDCEASYVINHDNYYYLFINRGSCCQGISSTYHIQVGRSLSPTGPFLDKNGKDLNAGGGTTVLSTNGDIIGPGCLGHYIENGIEWITYHYYDGANSGSPTLSVGTVTWDDSQWPVITNNWIKNGSYKIINSKSNLVWQYTAPGNDNDPVEQGEYVKDEVQKWNFQSVGGGYFKIVASGTSKVPGLEGCVGGAETKIVLASWQAYPCEIWKVERTNDGKYVLSSQHSNRVAEVPQSSIIPGTQLQINNYTGSENQKWKIEDTAFLVSEKYLSKNELYHIKIYPNPSLNGEVTIDFNSSSYNISFTLNIFTIDGKLVESRKCNKNENTNYELRLQQGVYMIQLFFPHETVYKKLIIQ